jgi:hypothetical protein
MPVLRNEMKQQPCHSVMARHLLRQSLLRTPIRGSNPYNLRRDGFVASLLAMTKGCVMANTPEAGEAIPYLFMRLPRATPYPKGHTSQRLRRMAASAAADSQRLPEHAQAYAGVTRRASSRMAT